ncbi:MAG: DUF3656 domain-containing protein [Peptococcaceae bacterium]|nr:DUF3656 domain-containing protein [Peptococcaceae bacterium]
MKEKEILAPAGSEAAFIAAVENGADAVYLGGKSFNARSYADNFEPADIRRLCRYAHLLGVKVFITLNILILPEELQKALDYARELAMAGVDALIVQDIGLAAALSRMVKPEVEVHASTQMTLMNSWGLAFAESLGCRRAVLAREVSAANIRKMKERSGMILEAFGHGALCSGWSGQCLMSSMLGGRSGNRGQCAQPCRLKYRLTDEQGHSPAAAGCQGQHLLSMKDLCTVDFLGELLDSGVDSFKLEGRMKQPEYVAVITRQYSQALGDELPVLAKADQKAEAPGGPGKARQGEEGFPEAGQAGKRRQILAHCFNRGFTSGYYLRRPGGHLLSRHKPNNQSQVDESLLQTARDSFKAPGCRRRREIFAELTALAGEPVRLVLRDEKGFRVQTASDEPCGEAKGEGASQAGLFSQLDRFGSTLFNLKEAKIRTDGKAFVPASLLNRLRRRAAEDLEEEILASWRRDEAYARKMAGVQAEILTELERRKTRVQTGGGFGLCSWEQPERENPAGSAAGPESQGFAVHGNSAPGSFTSGNSAPLTLTVALDTLAGLKAALSAGAREIYLGGQGFQGQDSLIRPRQLAEAFRLCHQAGARAYWSLPRFIHEDKLGKWREAALGAAEAGADGFLIGNPGGLILAGELGLQNLVADWSLNLYNDLSLALLADYGVARACLSPELTLEQIKVLGLAGMEKEVFAHGRLALMVTEHCLPGTLLGQTPQGDCGACSRPCRKNRWYLKDRLNFSFPVCPDRACRNWIYNAKTHCLLEHLSALRQAGAGCLRIEACQESPAWIDAVIRAYDQGLKALAAESFDKEKGTALKKTLAKLTPQGFTAGHSFRGVE